MSSLRVASRVIKTASRSLATATQALKFTLPELPYERHALAPFMSKVGVTAFC